MNQRLVQYSPETEADDAFEAGPLEAIAQRPASNTGILNEGQLLELAAEMLEASSQAALDRALGRQIALASRALAAPVQPAVAQALQSTLRRIAQDILPFAGRTLGAHIGVEPASPSMPVDTRPEGGREARAARRFGIELEGLSAEDKEFELAKRFVRLVAEALRCAASLPNTHTDAGMGTAQRLALRAVAQAARHVAPGLFRDNAPGFDFNGARRSARASTAANDRKEPTMHDIDRTQMEFSNEQFEFGENEWSPEAGGSFNEAEEMELATELLAVSNEGELDRFLGDLVSRATKAVGSFVRSPIGQAVGGVLKGVAKKALPLAGGAIGGYFGGPLGAKIGSGLANAAGSALGLEGEMANEDREFEGAKQFVRIAAQTAANAASAPASADPRAVAQRAATAAAMQHAPGLLSGGAGGGVPSATQQFGAAAGARSGRWLRRGNKLVIYGA